MTNGTQNSYDCGGDNDDAKSNILTAEIVADWIDSKQWHWAHPFDF